LENSHPNKVEKVLQLYKACGADLWAQQLKEKYYTEALHHLEEVAVISNRKEALKNLALYLMQREH